MLKNKNNLSPDRKNEALATLVGIRGSVLKLNLIAKAIKGKSIDAAFLWLKFSNKRASKLINECLKSAVANAEHNFNLDISRLVVSKVLVGQHKMLRRFMARGRGRSSSVYKVYSRVTVVVSYF